jgi:uncharacterized protein
VDVTLKTLIELQQTDQALAQLTAQIESSPRQVQTLREELSQFSRQGEEAKGRLAANQKERRNLDGDLQEIRAKIAKHKDQLYELKTNEQYKAMLHEIETEEGNARKVEDRILERMLESEQIEKSIREADLRLQSEKQRVETKVEVLESDREAAERRRDNLLALRKTLASGLSADLYELYAKLAKARNGMAVAEVRDGFCGGCHVRLRPQSYNDLRNSESLVTCETCGRILYYVPTEIDAADEPEAASRQQANL